MENTKFILTSASISLALALTFSCSLSDDESGGRRGVAGSTWCVNYDYEICSNKPDLIVNAQSCANYQGVLVTTGCPSGFDKEDYGYQGGDDPPTIITVTGYCLIYNECYPNISKSECEYYGTYYSSSYSCQAMITPSSTGYCLAYNECHSGYSQYECEYYDYSYYSSLSSCQDAIGNGGGYTGYCLYYGQCLNINDIGTTPSGCQSMLDGYFASLSDCQAAIGGEYTGLWCVNHYLEDCNNQPACTANLSACQTGWNDGSPYSALELMSSCPNGYYKFSSYCEL